MQVLKAQVCSVSRNNWKICDLKGSKITNADINNSFVGESLPVVGDFVDYFEDDWGNCFILKVNERKNLLARHTKDADKNIASNIDVIFIVSSLNNDFEIEKMERFCLIATVPNSKIVFLLTKSDLCSNIDKYINPLKNRFPDNKIIVLNSKDINDVNQLFSVWGKNETAIFLGSSGVGKSTLINTLLGAEVATTFDVRESDDKGRHTTTARNMYFLDNGRKIIDTPGIRSIQSAQNQNVQLAFDEIADLETKCKYNNCSHTSEDGCAVKKALECGILSKSEFERFKRIQASKERLTDKGKFELHKQTKFLKTKKIESRNRKKQK